MADWYVSSVVHAANPLWAASTAYTVGQLVRPTSPDPRNQQVHKCTVAGTSGATEPGWAIGNAQNTTSGTATFQNVSGQSVGGWGTAAGTLMALVYVSNRFAVGDRVFVSSDHVELYYD